MEDAVIFLHADSTKKIFFKKKADAGKAGAGPAGKNIVDSTMTSKLAKNVPILKIHTTPRAVR